MTDLTQIPVPNEGPITDKIKEIYERSFPPEEQIPLPELLTSAQMDQVSFLAWIDPSLPAGEDGAGNVVALTFSFVFPDLFYLGFLAVDGRTRSACAAWRSTSATVLRLRTCSRTRPTRPTGSWRGAVL